VVFEDFFTNERDKGFLVHVGIGRASGSQSGNLFAYPNANLLVVFGFHSFSLGRSQEKAIYRTLDQVFTSTTRLVNFWLSPGGWPDLEMSSEAHLQII
jgi:hypothetical protein